MKPDKKYRIKEVFEKIRKIRSKIVGLEFLEKAYWEELMDLGLTTEDIKEELGDY